VRSGSKRPPTKVGRVDGMSGTFILVLQDLALRKSTWYTVGSGAGRGRDTEQDRSKLVVAKLVPIPICLKLTAGKGLPLPIFSRDWNFYSNFEIVAPVRP
jgi:hypothetical protein